MWFRSLFDAWLARSPRTPVSRIRRGMRVRPLLESLEDRTLLSTYTVNALTDTGAGSGRTGDLRYCVTNATSGNDTITFAAGLTGTLQLQGALPTLNASVAIQGPGANQLTVAGDSVSSTYSSPYGICSMGIGAYVQISGLTLAHAAGAIDNAGSVVINNCTLSDNSGAIHNTGSATINNSILTNNSAGSYAGTIGDLDAVYNTGTLIVSGSTLTGNIDGAIVNDGSATVSNSTLEDNSDGGAFDGAIRNDSSLTVNISTLSSKGTVFDDNAIDVLYGGT